MFESRLIFGSLRAVQLFHTLDVIEHHRIGYNFFFCFLQRPVIITALFGLLGEAYHALLDQPIWRLDHLDTQSIGPTCFTSDVR